MEKCCPDLAFLIVFPSYWASGIPGTGHAAAAVLNGRTGAFRAYDFGPGDHVHKQSLGYVGEELEGTLPLDKNCLPECEKLKKIVKKIAEQYGKDFRHNVSLSGDIRGVMYAKPAGSYEKSVNYAADKAKINKEYNALITGKEIPEEDKLSKEYHYNALLRNCMTFAVSVIAGEESGRPLMVDWPADNIRLYQMFASMLGTGIHFSYDAKTGIFTCDGCCIETSTKEWAPKPEEMGAIPLGDGLHSWQFPWEF